MGQTSAAPIYVCANLCANINWLCLSMPRPNMFWQGWQKVRIFLSECVKEGFMIFCEKNILKHSMSFFGKTTLL